uniref:Uncharacterized protein n=1 Tax=Macrostomum lignano TaxID=282301 RepID=A0A1I8F6A7_9PLAT
MSGAAPSRAASPERFGLDVARWCADTSADNGEDGGGGGGSSGHPTGIRRVGRHRSRSLSKSAPSASMALADSNSLITWRRLGLRSAGAQAFDDSGTFSADSGAFAGLAAAAVRCSTVRSSLQLRRPSAANPRSPEVAARTSLKTRLLLNRLSLLSNSTPTPELENATRVNSAEADWLRHNSELTASSGGKRSREVGPQRVRVVKPSVPHPREDARRRRRLWHRQHAVSEDLVRHPEPSPRQRVQLTNPPSRTLTTRRSVRQIRDPQCGVFIAGSHLGWLTKAK